MSAPVVRQLVGDDYDAVVALGAVCFPGMRPWSRARFEGTTQIFPDGQLGVFIDDQLVASSSGLIIDSSQLSQWKTWDQITDVGTFSTHNPDGDTFYGIELMVHPDHRGKGLSKLLYQARKELVQRLGLSFMMIAGRMPGYQKYQHEMSPEEYVAAVQRGFEGAKDGLSDPVLTPQLAAGFEVERVVPNYIHDPQSLDHAVHMVWRNPGR